MLGVTQIKFIKDLLNLMVKNGKPTNKSAVTDKTERAYKILRDRIFSGYYLPRQRLVESALSEELGVNRFVIRDILKRFSVEKLVISEPYKGSVVAEVSLEEAFETYQVEAFLEGSAAFLATNRIKDEELKKLEQLIHESKKLDSQNLMKWEKYNRQIHKLMNRSCGNSKLIEMIRGNVKFMKYWFIVLSTPIEVSKRNKEHELILKAIKARDPVRVRKAVEDHIIETGNDMRKRLQKTFPNFYQGRQHQTDL